MKLPASGRVPRKSFEKHVYDEMFGAYKSFAAAKSVGVDKLAPMSDELRAELIKRKPDFAKRGHLASIFLAFKSALGKHMPKLADVKRAVKSEPPLRCDYDYNGGVWTGHLEQGFALRRGGVHFITMRLANDGFLYRDAIAEEIKSHIPGPHHNCEGWVQLKAPALPEVDPVFEFARTWLECPKEDVRIVVRYNSSAQRVDVTISIKACVEFEVLYEPGYPVQDIEDLWEPLP